MLRIKGQLNKDDGMWLIELPSVGAMTQAHTREEAFEMLKDYIECDIDASVDMDFIDDGGKNFEVGFKNAEQILPWILKKIRENSGKTLDEAKIDLKAKSRNAYARYEAGDCDPTTSKLLALLAVTNHHLCIE
jgi:predicted RNase H-like HicB family nuclease